MNIVVLGAGAGGGFPQWNSCAPPCQRARAGDPAALPCTQTSIAVSADGAHWFILNAAPDLRAQIERTPELHPRIAPRSTPIAGVLLTGAEVDTIAGLLTLRERARFGLFATSQSHARLDANPIFDVLARDVVSRVILALDAPCTLPLPDGAPSGLVVTGFAVPGKIPLYAEASSPDAAAPMLDGETIGLEITDGTARLVFVPGCAHISPALQARLHDADCLFFDATLWRDDEMILAGLGSKTGARMGHMSVIGPAGVMAAFRDSTIGRKILIHINNSNPLLLADSPERDEAVRHGWAVAQDGMRITL